MEELIQEGKNLIFIADIGQLKEHYDIWCQKVKGFMKAEGFSKKDQDEFILRAHYTNNEFFSEELQKSILNAIRNTTIFLDEVKQSSTIIISRDIALTIVERVLKNFLCIIRRCSRRQYIRAGNWFGKLFGISELVMNMIFKGWYILFCFPSFPQLGRK